MLKEIVDWGLYSLCGLHPTIKWVESLNFFIYDSIKILSLLFVMVSAVGFLRTYIPQDKVKKWISGRNYGMGNLFASLFGAVTPFCSCSSIPIFLSFLEAGIPLGVTFSFLITSPLVNEYLVVLMLGFFGWKITLAYVISGVLIGVVSGLILGKMKLEKYLVKDLILPDNKLVQANKIPANNKAGKEIKKIKHNEYNGYNEYGGIKKRLHFGLNEAVSIIKKLWLWILAGVGVGALIHNYVPSELIQSIVSRGGPFSVPLVVLLGVPMYGSCAAIVPIALALFRKGVPIGTALAFMMAIAALSFPEAVILRRAMKLKLIAIFFGIVTIAIILTGYIYNFLQAVLV